jgi:hypothetical protein
MNQKEGRQLLKKLREETEVYLQWGSVNNWSTRDFERLSDRIYEKTQTTLSVSTLKRLFGRARYEAVPNTVTLDTLARFLGYDNWREFESAHAEKAPAAVSSRLAFLQRSAGDPFVRLGFILMLLAGAILVWLSLSAAPETIDPNQVKFEVKRVAEGVPNTVLFEYDVRQIKAQKVELQQDWDPNNRYRLDKEGMEYAIFYNFPGYYRAKLIVDGQIIKEKDLFIPSQGWTAAIDASPKPRYLLENELLLDSTLRISGEVIGEIARSEPMNWLNFYNLPPDPEIDSRHFTFEAQFRHTLRTGNNICQHARIVLYGTREVLSFPFCIPGCVGDTFAYLNGAFISGKENDLSGFGCDLSGWVDFKVINNNNRLTAFVNGKKAIEHQLSSTIGKMGGVRFGFEGAGEIRFAYFNSPGGGAVRLLN